MVPVTPLSAQPVNGADTPSAHQILIGTPSVQAPVGGLLTSSGLTPPAGLTAPALSTIGTPPPKAFRHARVCVCGNVFMEDSMFCRICGKLRPQEPVASELTPRVLPHSAPPSFVQG